MSYKAVILAAGKGVRMRSGLPKVAHRVAGSPMVKHVVNAVRQAGIEQITAVVGYQRQIVQEILAGPDIEFVVQEQQLGTGHALLQAQGCMEDEDTILVLAGDTPLLQAATLKQLIACHETSQAYATVLSADLEDPYGYGRIIRNETGDFSRIVEEKDAGEDEKKIKEINSGIYCLRSREAFAALAAIGQSNAQGEYYLTDILEIMQSHNQKVAVFKCEASEDIYGINDRVQLSRAEAILRRRKNEELMRAGVTIIDPASTFIDWNVNIGIDTIIYPFTIIEGSSQIGERCQIGPAARITASRIGNDVLIESSRINEASIDDNCSIGPYAYLRPQAELHKGVKVGDFVEIKKSVIGKGSKVPHLSYVGDATIGTKVNVGAGTITCNYDGRNKWPTILEDGVFIGSNTNLVAPVRIGANSVTGAGSTITRDVPPNSLAVERAEQKVLKKRLRTTAAKPEE